MLFDKQFSMELVLTDAKMNKTLLVNLLLQGPEDRVNNLAGLAIGHDRKPNQISSFCFFFPVAFVLFCFY